MFERLEPVMTAGLARSASDVGRLNALSFSFLQSPVVPEECREQEDSCGDGVCTDPGNQMTSCDTLSNPNCLGICVGGDEAGFPCIVPPPPPAMPPDCDPAGFEVTETLVYALGSTLAPEPVLSDGIHANFGVEGTPPFSVPSDVPDENVLFLPTPEGHTAFAVHYYEDNGAPQQIKLVLSGTCKEMTALPMPDVLPITDAPAPYAGDLFSYSQALTEGCYPYVFVAQDGVGFEYTYPTYGSMQAKINAEGEVVDNDASCPVWTSARTSLSCVPSPQECQDGDTRLCYTGFYGTQDNGICSTGQETCQGGRWEGSCADQTLPEALDLCHDNLDNNCNGGVDEGCRCDYLDLTKGVCFRTKTTLERECVAPPTYQETETLCDGLDNDCDDVVDENCPCDFDGVEIGECAEAVRDETGVCLAPATFQDEESQRCDGLDNDCDGATDEGCECDFNDLNKGVCAAQLRDQDGVCVAPETYEERETLCDGRDNDCDGDADEDCASTCETSLDCIWEEGHGCSGRTSAGEKFCTTREGNYRDERQRPAEVNPECIDDRDCNGVCDPFGLNCVTTSGEDSGPIAASGDDLCGSPADCPLNYTCESREGIRQCIDPDGNPLEQPGCGGCQSASGQLPSNLPLLGVFGLSLVAMRRRRRRHEKGA